jgi:hypothetical protein
MVDKVTLAYVQFSLADRITLHCSIFIYQYPLICGIALILLQSVTYSASESGSYSDLQLDWLNSKKLHGLSLQANYTDRATAASRRSDCQLLRVEGVTWSA